MATTLTTSDSLLRRELVAGRAALMDPGTHVLSLRRFRTNHDHGHNAFTARSVNDFKSCVRDGTRFRSAHMFVGGSRVRTITVLGFSTSNFRRKRLSRGTILATRPAIVFEGLLSVRRVKQYGRGLFTRFLRS